MAIWRKNLEHEGIEIEFDGKPSDDIRSKLKSNGFRWSRFSKVWYSKGYSYQVDLANELAEYGGEVGEKLTFAEKMEAKEARAEARAERYSTYAENASKRSDQLYNEAHKMGDIIPLGQPILVGHYSEGRDRRYRDRIQNKFGKSIEEDKKAEYFERRAEAAADFKDRTFNLGTTLRRIEKLEAAIRSNNTSDRYKAKFQEEVDYWKAVVKQHEAAGLKVWGKADFKVGEVIVAGGTKARIRRVNPKSLTVEYIEPGREWMNALTVTKVPYNSLSQNCKLEV